MGDSSLTINGNSGAYSINGGNKGGITVASGQTLSIQNVGSLDSEGAIVKSINGFSTTGNGGFISNAGTLNITDSVLTGNSATGNGGAI
jgi:hypothetical protein